MSGKPFAPKITHWSAEQLQELLGISDDEWRNFNLTPTHGHYDDNDVLIPRWHRSVLKEIAAIYGVDL